MGFAPFLYKNLTFAESHDNVFKCVKSDVQARINKQNYGF